MGQQPSKSKKDEQKQFFSIFSLSIKKKFLLILPKKKYFLWLLRRIYFRALLTLLVYVNFTFEHFISLTCNARYLLQMIISWKRWKFTAFFHHFSSAKKRAKRIFLERGIFFFFFHPVFKKAILRNFLAQNSYIFHHALKHNFITLVACTIKNLLKIKNCP